MTEPESKSSKRFLSSGVEPLIMIGWQAFLFLALSNTVSSGFSESNSTLSTIVGYAREAVTHITPFVAPLFIAAYVLIYVLRAMGKNTRFVLDCLGIFLVVRTIAGFLVLNFLIVNPLTDNMMLLRQFLCFMPALIIGWGWIYWRLDQGARIQGRQLMLFPEDLPSDLREPLSTFDYYYHSAMVAFIFELSEVEPLSKSMKILFLINAAMMLDLVGLVLTQAIGLAGTK